jgi:pantetheine-phosphate adenylyltransferase
MWRDKSRVYKLSSMKKACFPGSFDPFTKGHEDVVRRGLSLFDEVVVAVGQNSSKQSLFALEKRLEHIRSLFAGDSRVTVMGFSGLTVDFCKANDCSHILRGLRDGKDFSYENPIALMNRTLAGIETVFLIPEPGLMAINSTIVREIYKNGGNIDAFVTNVHQLV